MNSKNTRDKMVKLVCKKKKLIFIKDAILNLFTKREIKAGLFSLKENILFP
jgi:hypothetical protein